MSDELWGYAEYEHPDRWEGAFPTKEAAIKVARTEIGNEFYLLCGEMPSPMQFMPSGEQILEIAGDRAADEAGEAAEDFPDVGVEALKELDDFLEAWAMKNMHPSFWLPTGKVERYTSGVGDTFSKFVNEIEKDGPFEATVLASSIAYDPILHPSDPPGGHDGDEPSKPKLG